VDKRTFLFEQEPNY